MDELNTNKLQISSQLFVTVCIFIVVVVASIAQLYILSQSLSDQLQDKAQIVARTLQIGLRESDMIELKNEIQGKIDELVRIRPDIIEIDVVVPDSSVTENYRMLASTGHTDKFEPPDRVDVEVIKSNTEHTMLEIINRESGEDIIERHTNHIDFTDVLQALFSKQNLYVWEIVEPLQNSAGNAIGSIAIEISMDEALQRIRHSIINTSKVFLGALILILFVVWITQQIFFVQPMNKLNKGIEKARMGDFAHKLNIDRNDEFGLLAKKYNSMIASITESRNEINSLNNSLQDRVQKATADLIKTNNLLSEKLSELKLTQQKLIKSERYAASALMAAGVAHEIRNPLHAIKISHSRIQEKYLDNEARNNTEYQDLNSLFVEQVGRIDNLMIDFLDYTRPVKLRLSKCSIKDLIHSSLKLSLMDASTEVIDVNEKYENNVPQVMVDEEVMKKALMNIFNNSLQAMPDGGLLSVEVTNPDKGDVIAISIGDTGIGIKERNLSEIFEPFNSNQGRKIGLGLAIVNRSIEAHSGKITVTSEVNKGTTFHIQLIKAPDAL